VQVCFGLFEVSKRVIDVKDMKSGIAAGRKEIERFFLKHAGHCWPHAGEERATVSLFVPPDLELIAGIVDFLLYVCFARMKIVVRVDRCARSCVTVLQLE
jgi:hypothetical protein